MITKARNSEAIVEYRSGEISDFEGLVKITKDALAMDLIYCKNFTKQEKITAEWCTNEISTKISDLIVKHGTNWSTNWVITVGISNQCYSYVNMKSTAEHEYYRFFLGDLYFEIYWINLK